MFKNFNKKIIRERNSVSSISLQVKAIMIKYLFKLHDYSYPSVMALINKI